jgi:hypothetical protein
MSTLASLPPMLQVMLQAVGAWIEAHAISLASLRAVPQPMALMEAPSRLAAVLLAEVVRWLPSPLDIARLDCTSRLFHLGAPRSAIEEGLRLRAEAAGRTIGASMPAGETSWAQWLLWEERRLLLGALPVASIGIGYIALARTILFHGDYANQHTPWPITALQGMRNGR